MSFGDDVRKARIAKGWSQERLAKEVGTTQASINRLEKGESARSRFAPEVAVALDLNLPISSKGAPRIIPLPPDPEEARLRQELPIFISSNANDGEILVSEMYSGVIDAPTNTRNSAGAFAIRVPNYDMAPAYEVGDLAIMNPTLPLVRDGDVLLCGAKVGTENNSFCTFKAAIRRLVDWDPETWRVKRWHGEQESFSRADWPQALRIVARLNRE